MRDHCSEYVFAHILYEIEGIHDYECIIYDYDLNKFHEDLAEMAISVGGFFYDHYLEYFNLADFPDMTEDLNDEEHILVQNLQESGEPDGYIMWEIINYRIKRLKRLFSTGKGTIEDIKSWVDLLNWYITCGTIDVNDTSFYEIVLGTAKDFAPYIMSRIHNCIEAPDCCYLKEFKPFRKRIKHFLKYIEQVDWSKNHMVFGEFLEWVHLYQCIVEDE